jgi:hypothetical protein
MSCRHGRKTERFSRVFRIPLRQQYRRQLLYIRYAVLTGLESEGHLTGEAFKALLNNGVDERKRIIGTDAPHPLLYNLPMECIERFRKQLSLIDLQFKGTPQSVRKAVWSCYQEEPLEFEGYKVHDIRAFTHPSISVKITHRIMEPWKQPQNEEEKEAVDRMRKLIDKLKKQHNSD